VKDEPRDESLMEATGLGLLPGVAVALGIVVFSMAMLLTGSPWAVALAPALLVTAVILAAVIGLIDEGELGHRVRRHLPGMAAPRRP
jgi:TRAP-type C4-dicarboxylate transport system permease small subunit